MILETSLLFAMSAAAIAPEFKSVDQRKALSFPLTAFLCDPRGPSSIGDGWAAVEIALNEKENLFGLNRRPDKNGKFNTVRIDGRISEYASVKHDDGSLSLYFKPGADADLQFEMRIAAGATEIGFKTVKGVLTRMSSNSQRDCMLVPPFSPIGTKQ